MMEKQCYDLDWKSNMIFEKFILIHWMILNLIEKIALYEDIIF